MIVVGSPNRIASRNQRHELWRLAPGADIVASGRVVAVKIKPLAITCGYATSELLIAPPSYIKLVVWPLPAPPKAIYGFVRPFDQH